MENLNKLYKDLETYKDFEVKGNIDHFLKILDEIIHSQKERSLPLLIKNLDDSSEYSWVNEVLQNNILYFFKSSGAEIFLRHLKDFLDKAPTSCEDTVSILFNSPEHFSLFRKHMHLADRESLLKLFDIMEDESPHHAELIQELRKELV